MTRLSDLKVGQTGRVLNVTGSDQITQRLLEMGVLAGVDIQVAGAAPLGDPIEVELRGYRLSVRRSEAQRVEVETA